MRRCAQNTLHRAARNFDNYLGTYHQVTGTKSTASTAGHVGFGIRVARAQARHAAKPPSSFPPNLEAPRDASRLVDRRTSPRGYPALCDRKQDERARHDSGDVLYGPPAAWESSWDLHRQLQPGSTMAGGTPSSFDWGTGLRAVETWLAVHS